MHRKYVLELTAKFRETKSVANKKRNIKKPLRNKTTKGAVLGRVIMNPTVSTRQLAAASGITRESIQSISKSYYFHPYKLKLVHKTNENDYDRRLIFC